jgi:hypothetical protein
MSELLLPLPAGTSSPPAREAVTINRPALIADLLLGYVLGMLPAWFMAGRPPGALRASAIIIPLVVLIVGKVKAQRITTRRPLAGGFVLGAAAATFVPAAFGLFWAGCHLLIVSIGWWLHRMTGWPARPDSFARAAELADWLLLLPIQISGIAVTLRNLLEQLYPDRAGVSSVFEGVRRAKSWHWFAIAATAPGLLLAVALVAHWRVSSGMGALLLIVALLAGAQLYTLSATTRQPREVAATSAIEGLLRSSGYDVLPAPRSGREDIDPVLADLALYARKRDGSESLAIDVVSTPSGQPVSWNAGVSLWTKTLALQQTQEASRDIKPVLVVLDGAPEERLREFTDRYSIRVVEGPEASVIEEGLLRPATLSDSARAFTERLTTSGPPSPEPPAGRVAEA